MFDLAWSEILVIGVVALIVIKPKDLPKVLRTVGYWVRHARQIASEFQSSLEQMAREAELSDVKKEIEEAGRKITTDIEKTIDPVEIEKAFNPPPSDPAPPPTAAELAPPPLPNEPPLPFPEPGAPATPPSAAPAPEPVAGTTPTGAPTPPSAHDRV